MFEFSDIGMDPDNAAVSEGSLGNPYPSAVAQLRLDRSLEFAPMLAPLAEPVVYGSGAVCDNFEVGQCLHPFFEWQARNQ